MFEKLFKTDNKKDFWKWFTQNQEEIYRFEGNQELIFEQISKKLKDIDGNLVFEFSPVHANGIREFSISADGIKASFPNVTDLIGKAPALQNWKFNAFRQRVPGNDISVKFGNGVQVGYADIFFRYAEEEDKIGIELNIRNYAPENKQIKNAVYILLDGLIGEYDTETRISWMDFVILDEAKVPALYPLTHLRDLVDLLKI